MSDGIVILTTVCGFAIVLFCLFVATVMTVRRQRSSTRVVKSSNETSVPNKPLTAEQYTVQQTVFIDNQATLQQRFFSLVSQSGKPKGLTWKR